MLSNHAHLITYVAGVYVHLIFSKQKEEPDHTHKSTLKDPHFNKDVANVPVLRPETLVLQYRHRWYDRHSARY